MSLCALVSQTWSCDEQISTGHDGTQILAVRVQDIDRAATVIGVDNSITSLALVAGTALYEIQGVKKAVSPSNETAYSAIRGATYKHGVTFTAKTELQADFNLIDAYLKSAVVFFVRRPNGVILVYGWQNGIVNAGSTWNGNENEGTWQVAMMTAEDDFEALPVRQYTGTWDSLTSLI